MSIKFITGDMFTSKAEALVNTVNCVGVMGKGVALDFKQRWPENFKLYKRACDAGALRPGRMLVFERKGLFDTEVPRFLINFPTKDHWRAKSRLEYIIEGLDALVIEIRRLQIKSIALPPLGCGNGGLDWEQVRPLIIGKLKGLEGVRIEIYGPSATRDDPEYVNLDAKMTVGRALFLRAIAALEPRFGGSVDRLSLQKVAYFLQELGSPMNLVFTDSLYGPYSDRLKKSLVTLNSWRFISGFNDAHRQIQVTRAGYAAADEFLVQHAGAETVVERLLHLIEGYESPYGLELLSTLHFQLKARPENEIVEIVDQLSKRAAHRRNRFPTAEVSGALSRLRAERLTA